MDGSSLADIRCLMGEFVHSKTHLLRFANFELCNMEFGFQQSHELQLLSCLSRRVRCRRTHQLFEKLISTIHILKYISHVTKAILVKLGLGLDNLVRIESFAEFLVKKRVLF
jgi:hypothetical protein